MNEAKKENWIEDAVCFPRVRMVTELNGVAALFYLEGELPEFDQVVTYTRVGEETDAIEEAHRVPNRFWVMEIPCAGQRLSVKVMMHFKDGSFSELKVIPSRIVSVKARMRIIPKQTLRMRDQVVIMGWANGVPSIWKAHVPPIPLEKGEPYELTMEADWKGPGCLLAKDGEFAAADSTLRARNVGPVEITWDHDDGVLKPISAPSLFQGVFLAEPEEECECSLPDGVGGVMG